jgi:hypothetical protein
MLNRDLTMEKRERWWGELSHSDVGFLDSFGYDPLYQCLYPHLICQRARGVQGERVLEAP